MRSLCCIITLACSVFAGCASNQAMHLSLTDAKYPPKPDSFVVEFFQHGALPERPYKEIAKLNIHMEKTHFLPSPFSAAKKQLEKQARALGADAVIKIEEDRSRINETLIYNVAAVAIVYLD